MHTAELIEKLPRKASRYLRWAKKNTDRPEGQSVFLVGEDGFEPSKALPADLQSVPFGHSGIPPYAIRQ